MGDIEHLTAPDVDEDWNVATQIKLGMALKDKNQILVQCVDTLRRASCRLSE
jgi:hypothetical protein